MLKPLCRVDLFLNKLDLQPQSQLKQLQKDGLTNNLQIFNHLLRKQIKTVIDLVDMVIIRDSNSEEILKIVCKRESAKGDFISKSPIEYV